MITEKDILDMYAHLRTTNSTIPDEAIDFMKNSCIEALNPTRYSFTAEAKRTKVDGISMVGVWTDGVTFLSDNGHICEYGLAPGEEYKVSIVKIKK